MNKFNWIDAVLWVAFAVFIYIVIGWLFPETRDTLQQVERLGADVHNSTLPEWCLQEELPRNGGSFGEVEGGEYEYLVMQTATGIKVFTRCEYTD